MGAAALAAPAQSAASELLGQGWTIVRDALPRPRIDALSAEIDDRFVRTPFSDGLFSGSRTKRFHGLLKRSRIVSELVLHRQILALVEEALLPFCDSLQLNLTQAIEIHPGSPAQVPHRDQDMWGGEKGCTEYLVNVMWPLTPFRRENGGTLLWSGTQRRQDERRLPPCDAVSPELEPSDALLFLGSTLHAGGANRTLLPRRGIIISYCLGWLKPYENMWLTYPPEVARGFSSELQAIIGYRRHRPNLGNYDGQCPSVLLGDGVGEYVGARDALTRDQERRIAAFLTGNG